MSEVPFQLAQQLAATIPDAELALTSLPLAPEVSLWLIRDSYPRGPLDDEVARAITRSLRG